MTREIRFATKSESKQIMMYIDQYWRKGHILTKDETLFHWQYDGVDDRLNFVLGIEKNESDASESIKGILGFVPYDNSSNKDICLALWNVNKDANGFLGIQLLKYLIDYEPHRAIVCTGINKDTTEKIYNFLGIKVREMIQWYRLGDRNEYKIAKICNAEIPKTLFENKYSFYRIDEIDKEIFPKDHDSIPYKNAVYLKHRYFDHPSYKYLVYGVGSNKINKLLLVFRIQECMGSKALRLIDCIGNVEILYSVMPHIDELIRDLGCEYCDFYQTGLDEQLLYRAGWRTVKDSNNIIPNYFSPFEQRNVQIYCAASLDKAVLFKGDGDQDRPN